MSVINYILNDLGATVFMPIMLILIGLLLRLRIVDSVADGLMLGMGIFIIKNVSKLMENAMSPVVTSFSSQTGANLDIIDVGWPVCEAIAFACPYIFACFLIAIAVNIVMLVLKWTNCLNIDIFNFWYLSETCIFVYVLTNKLWLAFAMCVVQVVLQLKIAESMSQHCRKLTGIKNVTASVPPMMSIMFVYPVELLLRKIPFLNKDLSIDTIHEKYGDFFSPHVMGFLVGTILSLLARYSIAQSLQNGIVMGAVLYALPILSQMFMKAFMRISQKLSGALQGKFGDRDFCIGLDWPFLGGRAEMWLCNVLVTPFTLAMALILPNVRVIFLVTMGSYVTHAALVATGANLLHMLILGIVFQPIAIYFAGYVAPLITQAATLYNAYEVLPGQLITGSVACPELRYVMFELCQGHLTGIVALVVFAAVAWVYFHFMTKESKQIKAELDAEEASMGV